jgi:hypothetical protein
VLDHFHYTLLDYFPGSRMEFRSVVLPSPLSVCNQIKEDMMHGAYKHVGEVCSVERLC